MQEQQRFVRHASQSPTHHSFDLIRHLCQYSVVSARMSRRSIAGKEPPHNANPALPAAALSLTSSLPLYPADLWGLHPVRLALLSFLEECDVAILLRAGRAVSAFLSPVYSFRQHVFFPRVQLNETSTRNQAAGLWDYLCCHRAAPTHRRPDVLLSPSPQNSLFVRRMQLPVDFDGPLMDDTSGQSLLPRSLAELWLGNDLERKIASPSPHYWAEDEPWRFNAVDDDFGLLMISSASADCAAPTLSSSPICPQRLMWRAHGAFNQCVPVGCLPETLRVLFFGESFNQPLLVGSLPASLTFCCMGAHFDHTLAEGVLPSRLRDLLLPRHFNRPLAPGVLPASLRRLVLGFHFNQPLLPGTLPSELQWLDLGHDFNHPLPPGTIPLSCTTLLLSDCFNHTLSRGCLPDGLLQLRLACDVVQSLEPGDLPATLRNLALRYRANQILLPGVIPSRLVRLDISLFEGQLMSGSIPQSVRELHIPYQRSREIRQLVHPDARGYSEQAE